MSGEGHGEADMWGKLEEYKKDQRIHAAVGVECKHLDIGEVVDIEVINRYMMRRGVTVGIKRMC